MKVLITGAGGQLGRLLVETAPASYGVFAFTHAELNITDSKTVLEAVNAAKPDVIVNAAAYTAVDKAETERDLAFAVNADGIENLARSAIECGARLIHVSTDFVFDGQKSSPYLPEDEMHSLGVYGASKAEGERRVRALMGDNAVIIRTGWVYAAEGHNFVRTILRLLAEKDRLNVICDQVGTPTWAGSLADVVWKVAADSSIRGTHHWSDAGVASWYDFAVAIQEEAIAIGLIEHPIPITPISTAEYPLPAKRPAYSVLDKRSLSDAAGIIPTHWRVRLREMLRELARA